MGSGKKNHRFSVHITVLLKAVFLITISFVCSMAIATEEQTKASASDNSDTPVCEIGLYILEIFDIKTHMDFFKADFWVWSICPNEKLDAVKNADYINALELPDTEIDTSQPAQGIYSSQRIRIPFHHRWDIHYFPFDRPTLKIQIEDSVHNLQQLAYKADLKNSGIGEMHYLGDWEVTDFSLVESNTVYPTNYGDPNLKEGSTYARITAVIELKRNGLSLFIRMVAGVFASVIIALMAFFLNSKYESLYSGQFGLVVGALFGVLVNQRATDSVLGNISTTTLIDYVHIVALIYIILIGINVIYTRHIIQTCPETTVPQPNIKRFLIFLLSYVAVNVFLVVGAYVLAN